MNGTTLKFNHYLSSSLYCPMSFYPPFAVAVGLVWMLTFVCISRVEAITVNDLMPVIKDPIKPPEEARKVATKLIEELGPLIQKDDELAKGLGLIDPSKPPPDKAPQLNIQEKPPGPMAVFYVGLKVLQEFSSFKPPSDAPSKEDLALSLLTETTNWSDLSGSFSPRRFLYPIMDGNGQIVSSVLVGLGGNKMGWHVLRFGSSRLTQALTNSKFRESNINYFAINIRSLNRWYLGWISGEQLMLTAIVNDPSIKFSQGESRTAKEIFLALEKEAKTIDINDPAPR